MNPSLPQTLQIAIFLLYFRAFFDLLDLFSHSGQAELARIIKGTGTANLVVFGIIALEIAGGYFTAQERKWGYKIALVAALAPFALNFWITSGYGGLNIVERLSLGSLSNFSVLLWVVFHVALVALVLHPMSRDYQRIWFK